MKRHNHVLIVLAVSCAAALALTACGGDDDSQESEATAPTEAQSPDTTAAPDTTVAETTTVQTVSVDPCTLVTKDQASTLTGIAMQDGVSITEPTGDGGGCRYGSDPTGPTAQVAVFVGEGAKTYYDTDTRIGHTFTPVADLGDEAYEEELAIFVRKGATWFAINVPIGGDTATLPEQLREAATEAVAQL
jgi:hypothetical protein